MDLTKFFTALGTAGAKAEASAEDMKRGYSDAGVEPMPDDGAWFMPQDGGGGGFLGRAKGWER